MEVVGKVKVIGLEQEVTPTFKKRELVVVTNEQYPQSILIEFAQDKCAVLNNYSVGNEVKVSINLRGREWINPQGETKYFNQIQGWKIEKLSDSKDEDIEVHDAKIVSPTRVIGEDDLPF
jgi:translation initiation factor IF-3